MDWETLGRVGHEKNGATFNGVIAPDITGRGPPGRCCQKNANSFGVAKKLGFGKLRCHFWGRDSDVPGCADLVDHTLGILAHLLRMVMEPKDYAFRR